MEHKFADRIARRITKVKREENIIAAQLIVDRLDIRKGTEDHDQVLERIRYWHDKPVGDV